MIKRMIKRACAFLLVTVIGITSVTQSYAAEVGNVEDNAILYDSSISRSPRYGEREQITVIKTEMEKVYVTPSGQLPGGLCFPTGGSIIINPNKGGNQSISVGVSWGVVSVAVSTGAVVSKESVGGVAVKFPADNHYYQVDIERTMRIERHKVDVYKYNEYQYTYYSSASRIEDQKYVLRKIK